MKVLVCGGRAFTGRDWLFQTLDELHAKTPIEKIISGGARGADTIAEEWARSRGVDCERYPANWSLHGRSAGARRNVDMLRRGKPDMVIAFPGGRGTDHMVRIARAAGVFVTFPTAPPDMYDLP